MDGKAPFIKHGDLPSLSGRPLARSPVTRRDREEAPRSRPGHRSTDLQREHSSDGVQTGGDPPHKPFPTQKPWYPGDPYNAAMPVNGDPWEECFKQVHKLDDEMCKGWRDEIDTMMIFAGLFSATVTAFTIESYQWLQEDASETLARLQLDNLLNGRPLSSSFTTQDAPFVATASSIRINTLWFTSLTLSLTSVLVGILCKQWLREYQRYENLVPQKAFSARQMRYEGLVAWHVPTIISFLPLFLQAALILFFAGVLDLLWSLQHIVASVVTIFVGLSMLLVVATTLLPGLQNIFQDNHTPYFQCAYKSPQSWAILLLLQRFRRSNLDKHPKWVEYDASLGGRFVRYTVDGLSSFYAIFRHNPNIIHHTYHCLESLDSYTAGRCVLRILESLAKRGIRHPDTLDLEPVLVVLRKLFPENTTTLTSTINDPINTEFLLGSFASVHGWVDQHFFIRWLEHSTRLLNASSATNEVGYQALNWLEQLNSKRYRPRLSNEMTLQSMTAVSALFIHNHMSTPALETSWVFFEDLMWHRQTERTHGDLQPGFISLLQNVERWLTRTPVDLSSHDELGRVMCCVRGMINVYHPRNVSIGTVGGDEFGKVVSVLRVLDNMLDARNFPDTAWWTSSWQKVKDHYLADVLNPIE